MNSTTFEERVRLPFLLTILFVACVALYSPDKALAQWTQSGNNISNTNSGNVGIGTTAPGQKLVVNGYIAMTSGRTKLFYRGDLDSHIGSLGLYSPDGGPTAIITPYDNLGNNLSFSQVRFGGFGSFESNTVGLAVSGNVGVGTTNPSSPAGFGQVVNLRGSTSASFVADGGGLYRAEYAVSSNGGWVSTVDSIPLRFATSNTERMRIDSTGRVGIGTTSPSSTLHIVGDLTLTGTGNISATGNIAAKYQDVAEWVPSRRAIPAGTVVVLDAERSNHVLPSSRAYDTSVAGVVSAKPGVILGEGGAGKVMVATTGRVRVKADATSAPIRVGDLLVTSDREGIAMRSQPLDLGGTPIHRPGTLIGKALEPLDKGIGEILVLLSLQ
jgi:ethanolamine utilization microcompartment shell protein EutS